MRVSVPSAAHPDVRTLIAEHPQAEMARGGRAREHASVHRGSTQVFARAFSDIDAAPRPDEAPRGEFVSQAAA